MAEIVKKPSEAAFNILVIRPDRIGDVLLSTPVFAALRNHFPRAKLSVMVRELVAPVIRGLPGVDEVLTYDPTGRHAGFRGFFTLVREIRERKIRIAVVLQTQVKIAAALLFAGVRFRVGPLSKIHSYFIFNRGMRQSRSNVEMHETDYNLQLLRRLGIRVGSRQYPVRAHVSVEEKKSAADWLDARGWSARSGKKLIVVHPGMGGSALNWPEDYYLDLIHQLIREDYQVLISGGPGEQGLMDRIRDSLGDLAAKVIFFGGKDAGTIEKLGGILSYASLMVAPSTGPLHLAVALAKPVVTFYPPIRVQSAIRWGPYLADESRASVLVPEVYCGQDFECRGSLCNYYPCMRGLIVGQALEEAKRQLARPTETNNG
ncbi:glycosyltransferase family 9 protein [bacterium]|nr:glycosyltransferase family 9 protein [bacterium]